MSKFSNRDAVQPSLSAWTVSIKGHLHIKAVSVESEHFLLKTPTMLMLPKMPDRHDFPPP